jgi:hypothetical protein
MVCGLAIYFGSESLIMLVMLFVSVMHSVFVKYSGSENVIMFVRHSAFLRCFESESLIMFVMCFGFEILIAMQFVIVSASASALR